MVYVMGQIGTCYDRINLSFQSVPHYVQLRVIYLPPPAASVASTRAMAASWMWRALSRRYSRSGSFTAACRYVVWVYVGGGGGLTRHRANVCN